MLSDRYCFAIAKNTKYKMFSERYCFAIAKNTNTNAAPIAKVK
jgi:hypothetical protein